MQGTYGPSRQSLPETAGIGVRGPHYRALSERSRETGWLEAHSENYFGAGGAPVLFLERLRRDYPLSLHGVGLSIGSTDPLDRRHLNQLKALVDRFEPAVISEHLSWSSVNGCFFNDLLPLPYTEEALRHFADRVSRVQDFLGRQMLIENPSSYLAFEHSVMPEPEFLGALCERSGCGLLLDVNNVHVSASNLGLDPGAYLRDIPAERVQEIHLAGFAEKSYPQGTILIDHHGAPVHEDVWALYRSLVRRIGPRPTLIEWDTNIPELDVLLAEAARADRILEEAHARAA